MKKKTRNKSLSIHEDTYKELDKIRSRGITFDGLLLSLVEFWKENNNRKVDPADLWCGTDRVVKNRPAEDDEQ